MNEELKFLGKLGGGGGVGSGGWGVGGGGQGGYVFDVFGIIHKKKCGGGGGGRVGLGV